jgi:hypothetical protein
MADTSPSAVARILEDVFAPDTHFSISTGDHPDRRSTFDLA